MSRTVQGKLMIAIIFGSLFFLSIPSSAERPVSTLYASETVHVVSGGLKFPVRYTEQILWNGDEVITMDHSAQIRIGEKTLEIPPQSHIFIENGEIVSEKPLSPIALLPIIPLLLLSAPSAS